MRAIAISAGLAWLSQVQGFAVPPQANVKPRQEFKAKVFSTDSIIPTDSTVEVDIIPVPTGTLELLPELPDGIEPQTTGTVFTSVSRRKSPLLTSPIPEPSRLLKAVASPTLKKPNPEATSSSSDDETLDKRQSGDIFANPIGTGGPPSQIPRRSDHPVSRDSIAKNGVIPTNKFFAGFHLGSQTDPIYPFPYSLQWPRGTGVARSWGIAISHIEERQRVFGANQYNNAAEYYLNPVGIQSMILSAAELGGSTTLRLEDVTSFSARAVLRPSNGAAAAVSFPLVQGMPYVTGQYTGARPIIQTGVFFRSMTRVQNSPKSGVTKYNFLLEDGTTWVVYGHATSGAQLDLQLTNNGLAESRSAFTGTVQIVKNPGGADGALDDGAGIYPTGVRMSGSVSGSSGSYSMNFNRAGHGTGSLYMYALPHHVESFNSDTAGRAQNIRLQTLTKGQARLVRGDSWTMQENSLPTSMDFAPWDGTSKRSLSTNARNAILPIARADISQNMDAQSNLDSMYFSGKALAKFAQIVYLTNDLLGDSGLAQAGLNNLKAAFNRFASNQQRYPLTYESAWGGVVSTASYTTGDPNMDFGNAYYNDHHFHYGYHILAAAYIGHLDRNWINANRDYVNMLVRDVANPSTADTWYPQWRNFDWYHGHSWAHGLYPAADGKNQESSSEDAMAAYAIKMWGSVIGDADMVARANLMLAVQTRSFRNYYYYEDNNPTQPSRFIGNRVAGILFENKVHHTTFFSADIEAIQGIHMIPVHGPTGLVRNKNFIRQEWDSFFSNGRVDRFDNPWKSIAYAQYALVNPQAAWSYFASGNFQERWVDGGASRSWYMAYAAALGGA